MFDFIDWFIENRNKPLGYIILAAFVFLIDRFGRKLITDQVKRLFHVEDKTEFKQYVQNQQRIEEKLELLLQKEGITWHAPTSPLDSADTATRRRRLFLPHWVGLSPVRAAIQYINYWRFKMSNINKGILIPLLSAIALFVKEAFGYEISTELIDMSANIILYLIMAAGLFMNFKKKKDVQKDDTEAYYH
ncbi:hypothetical protein [Paenibacillus harenae]|uniref:hypothetical protein n=1 Tax=Paenibacillus harenae TaxID=306543 RepID=UPI0027D78ECD|nr:hypothetical protein [Paenibacillus harenae]